MSFFGVVFMASLAVLFVGELKRGGRLRFFSVASIYPVILAFIILTAVLFKILAPQPSGDAHGFLLVASVETALAIVSLGYVLTSMMLRR